MTPLFLDTLHLQTNSSTVTFWALHLLKILPSMCLLPIYFSFHYVWHAFYSIPWVLNLNKWTSLENIITFDLCTCDQLVGLKITWYVCILLPSNKKRHVLDDRINLDYLVYYLSCHWLILVCNVDSNINGHEVMFINILE